jgi:uncharacterized protein (DUF58 family)
MSPILISLAVAGVVIILWSRQQMKDLLYVIDKIYVERIVEKNRVVEGYETDVVIKIFNETDHRIPLVIVKDDVPRGLVVSKGSDVARLSIPPRSYVENVYSVRGERVGRHDLRSIKLLFQDPLGIFSEEKIYEQYSYITVTPIYIKIDVYPKIRSVYPGIKIRGASLGGSYDLWGFRDYVSGDDVRRIYWKGFARTGRLMVREDIGESRGRVLIMLGLTKYSWLIGSEGNTYAESLLRLFRSLLESFLDAYSIIDIMICTDAIVKIFREITSSNRERIYVIFDDISFGGGCGSIGILLLNLYRIDLSRYDIKILATTPPDIFSTDRSSISLYLKQNGFRGMIIMPNRDYDKDIGPMTRDIIIKFFSKLGSDVLITEESFEKI